MSDAYDFSRLTSAQQELLTFGGWAPGSPNRQPIGATVRKLLDRGLVVQREVREARGHFIHVTHAYDVPLPVHMAWCARCAKRAGTGGA